MEGILQATFHALLIAGMLFAMSALCRLALHMWGWDDDNSKKGR